MTRRAAQLSKPRSDTRCLSLQVAKRALRCTVSIRWSRTSERQTASEGETKREKKKTGSEAVSCLGQEKEVGDEERNFGHCHFPLGPIRLDQLDKVQTVPPTCRLRLTLRERSLFLFQTKVRDRVASPTKQPSLFQNGMDAVSMGPSR